MIYFHWPASIVSIVIGLVLVGPFIYFIYRSGNEYKGIYMFRSDAELHYLARMNIGINEWTTGNPFLEDTEKTPSPLLTVSEIFLATPSKITGISVPNLNLIYKFLLPTICSLLVYSLFFRLINSRLWSIAGTIMIMLGSFLFNIPDLAHLFKWENDYGQFLPFDRPVNPELSSILFFSYLHALFSFLRDKSNKNIYILTVLLGLSFYVYFYSFTFFLTLNFVLLLYFLYKKEFLSVKKLVISTVFGMIIGSYAIINIYNLYTHPYFSSLSKLGDISYSNAPIVSLAWLIVFGIFVITNIIVKQMPFRGYIILLLATSFLVTNQQVITGIFLQQGHYHWYFNVPIYAIAVTFSLFYLLRGKRRFFYKAVALFICLLSFLQAFLVQSSSYVKAYEQTVIDNKYASVLDWLRERPKSVVLAEDFLSALIPVYTKNKIVWEDHAGFYLMSDDRRSLTNSFVLNNLNNKEYAKRLKIDYIVLDQKRVEIYNLQGNNFLKEVYKDDTFVIYAFKD